VSQAMDDSMRCVLGAGAKMEDGKNLRTGVDDQPEPQHVLRAAQPCAQFVQLQMREPEMGEEAFVQDLCMFPSASEPGGDGGLSKAEDPLSRGRIQPFGQPRRAPWRSAERKFSDGTGQWCAWK
jgi:hypothetical protein